MIKQMFDCATLLREINDFSEVKKTYKEIVKIELAYRELNIDYKEVLLDTIKSAAVIIGRGSLYKSDEIAVYSTGIRAIGSHLLSKKYDFAIAGFDAAQVMYLASSILSDSNDFSLIKNISDYNDCKIENKDFSSLSSLRKISLDTYAYIVEATKLL